MNNSISEALEWAYEEYDMEESKEPIALYGVILAPGDFSPGINLLVGV
jgi:hypothetical protein